MIKLSTVCFLLASIYMVFLSRPSRVTYAFDHNSALYILRFGRSRTIRALMNCIVLPLCILFIYLDYGHPVPLSNFLSLEGLIVLVFVASFPLEGARMLLETRTFVVTLTSDALVVRRPFYKTRIIEWKSIIDISFDRRSLSIRTNDGTTIKLSRMLDGMTALAEDAVAKTYPSVARRIALTFIQMKLLAAESFDQDGSPVRHGG